MARVVCASRLHFGLLALPDGASRHYGGVGLMVKRPGVQVSAQPAAAWSASGPCAERALAFGRRFVKSLGEPAPAFAMVVERGAPEHAGLGTGTQLAMAVARALAGNLALDLSAVELGCRVGRGQRSGIGVHGFESGGLIVDGGKGPRTTIAPRIARDAFPDDWRVLLFIPADQQGEHAQRERQAFAHLAAQGASTGTGELARLVLLGILPTLIEHDLPAFGASLYEFNRRVGEMFAPWQGGIYANPISAAAIDWLRRQGIDGVGQSSWGPTVFAIEEEDRLRPIRTALLRQFSFRDDEVLLTAAANRGADCSLDAD